MSDWYPLAFIDPGNNAGPYTDQGEPKGLLHTTEGKSFLGARGAYVANNSWPHFTCSYERGFFQCWQHNPLSLASRALRNTSAPGEVGRDNVVQIELVGTANTANKHWGDQYVENFPTGYKNGIKELMKFIEQQRGVPPICNVTFLSYPDSYGNNGVRLNAAQWDSYTGWLGHQHAVENLHGDPGLIAIDYLLDRGDWFDMDKQEFFNALDEYNQFRAIVDNLVTPGVGDKMTPAGASSYIHEATYWPFVNGLMRPIICTTTENPTLWYMVGPGLWKAGPFTAIECEDLVAAEVASFHRTTDPTWRPFRIDEWVMDKCKLYYEHLPV